MSVTRDFQQQAQKREPELVIPQGVKEVTAYFAGDPPPELAAYMAQHIHIKAWKSPQREAVEQLAVEGALRAIGQLVDIAPHTVTGLARWAFDKAQTEAQKRQARDCVVEALTRLIDINPVDAIRSAMWASKYFPRRTFFERELPSIVAEAGRVAYKTAPRLAQEAAEWVAERVAPCPCSY